MRVLGAIVLLCDEPEYNVCVVELVRPKGEEVREERPGVGRLTSSTVASVVARHNLLTFHPSLFVCITLKLGNDPSISIDIIT